MSGACRPLEDWPDLVLGPMVRRVTSTTAAVFIATCVPCTASLALKTGRHSFFEIADGDFPEEDTPLHRIGQWLWVGLLEAPLPEDADPGDTVSYDVRLRGQDWSDGSDFSKRLADLGELGGGDLIQIQTPLGYQPNMLPSFLTPPATTEALRLAHSSCRRPAGGLEGEPDALTILDEVIALSLGAVTPMPAPSAPPPASNRKRPHQLLLTGDQIYADDVASALLAALTEAGEGLLGWTEHLPGVTPGQVGDFLIRPGWRSRYLKFEDIKDVASTGDYDFSANHLLTFGEWCAMYVFVWSDALWRRSDDGKGVELPEPGALLPVEEFQTALGWVETFTRTQPVSYWFTWGLSAVVFLNRFTKAINDRWEETKPQAERFGASVRKVRRLLANVSTFMIFDDHEVTDDWYLNRDAADTQLGVSAENDSWTKDLGPRLLRNGLSAYAIFQHWGNCPEDFAGGAPGAQLLLGWEVEDDGHGGIRDPGLAGGEQHVPGPMDPATHVADALLGIDRASHLKPAGTPRDEWDRLRWDYVVPFASHRLVVLDTRTWRFFPEATPFVWPQGLDPAERTPGDTSTVDYIEGAAAEWANTTALAGSLAGHAFSDLLTACVAAVLASDAAATERELLKVVDAGKALLACEPPPWSSLNAVTVEIELDRLQEFLAGSGATTRTEQLWEAASRLRRIASLRTEHSYEPLANSLAALAGLLETAETGTTRALAASAARVAAAIGTDMIKVFTEDEDLHDDLAAAVNSVGADITDALTELEPHPLSDWFFRDGSAQLGAQLISDDALGFQLTEAIDTGQDAPPHVIVSPAPIFGNPVVEAAQRAALVKDTLLGRSGALEQEYEAWGVNMPGMRSLLLAGNALERCVVLSGDVHYANSSVNDVELLDDAAGVVLTRYIQLTSSSSRNADGKTLGGGYADDFLWTECSDMRLAQLSISKLAAPGGPDPPEGLGGVAGWAGWLEEWAKSYLEGKVENLAEAIAEEFEDLKMTPLELLRDLITAPINSLYSWSTEAIYTIWSIGNTLTDLYEDPKKTIFGDYVFARDVIRQQLIDLYQHVGVDPTVGVQVRRTMLRDLREGRLYEYPGADRFDPDEEKYTKGWTHTQFIQTVGASNVGLVRFDPGSEGGIESVRHELLWFPVAEPDSADWEIPPIPDGLVIGAERRADWMGTLHECAWSSYAHRVDDKCLPAAGS